MSVKHALATAGAAILIGGAAVAQHDARTQMPQCVYQGGGALPDSRCTPGAVRPDATAEQICDPSYRTGTYRDVSDGARRQVAAEYGVAWPEPPGSTETDHLVPLLLGGSNDVANLWPQPADPRPGFHEKDRVEVAAGRAVCDGALELGAAQQRIASDWVGLGRELGVVQ